MDPFLGEIRIFGFNFAPKGWALANGQLLPISQNTALFALLGTQYGGDGKSTFALPNLQGSVAVNHGQGPGLQEWFIGQQQGSDTVTLLQSEMPAHNHLLQATTTNATGSAATAGQLGRAFKGNLQSSNTGRIYSTDAPNQPMVPSALKIAGGDQPHNNLMPYLVLNYCIALQGVFPARN